MKNKLLVVWHVEALHTRFVDLSAFEKHPNLVVWFFFKERIHLFTRLQSNFSSAFYHMPPTHGADAAGYVAARLAHEMGRNPVYHKVLLVTDQPQQYSHRLGMLHELGANADIVPLQAAGEHEAVLTHLPHDLLPGGGMPSLDGPEPTSYEPKAGPSYNAPAFTPPAFAGAPTTGGYPAPTYTPSYEPPAPQGPRVGATPAPFVAGRPNAKPSISPITGKALKKARKMKLPTDRATFEEIMDALLKELVVGKEYKRTDISPLIHKTTGKNVKDLFKHKNLSGFYRYLLNYGVIEQKEEDSKYFVVLTNRFEMPEHHLLDAYDDGPDEGDLGDGPDEGDY